MVTVGMDVREAGEDLLVNKILDKIFSNSRTFCYEVFENIALDSTSVSQSGIYSNRSSLYRPKLVVDGYNDTNRNIHYRSDTETDNSTWQWWFIDLQEEYPIGYLKIFHRYDRLYVFKGFSVHIDNELCFQHTGSSNPPAVFPIECYGTLTGRYVNISRYSDTLRYIGLCEVELYGMSL
ncbi:hypothetical protein LOTGIDRAFT_156001 [Lottia gigantea]|uniref:Fucolectin tachylectin-4 pentraxin-1 domain-containing protein n=1 Tax=Lottia gigantea TaxID=225164 RepID=V4BFU8_LOTGI|nr:hypothetical protein LOTGIDRAFT_156001 [Lottia gigantea]ESP04777.1 hypothetical protein LOTGIDRAFT_156001 [Lottia gigantea]